MRSELVCMYKFNGTNVYLPFHIYEHTKATKMAVASGYGFATGQKANAFQIPFGLSGDIRIGPNQARFIEFRFPHHMKSEFYKEFFPGGVRKRCNVQSPMAIHATYGKLNTDQKPLISKATLARQMDGGMLNGALTAAESAAALSAALGAAAAGGPITIGVAAGVIAVSVSAAAVKQHVENKKSKQVFVRLSNDRIAYQRLWSYEEKHYEHKQFGGANCQLMDIGEWIAPA